MGERRRIAAFWRSMTGGATPELAEVDVAERDRALWASQYRRPVAPLPAAGPEETKP